MYVSTKQKIKTLVIAALLVIAIPVITYATYLITSYLIRAGQDTEPTNILVTDITPTSAVITYYTEIKTSGSVKYKLSSTAGVVTDSAESTSIADKRGASSRQTHYFELTGLEPNSTYELTITSGAKRYPEESESMGKLEFKTAPLNDSVPVPAPVFGNVQDVAGDDAIVYIWGSASGSETIPLTSTIREGGNWISDLSGLVMASNLKPGAFDKDTIMTILVLTGDGKSIFSTAKYGELFDNSGKLLSSVVLAPEEGNEHVMKLPLEIFLGETATEPPIVEPPIEEEPEEEPPVEEEPEEEPEEEIPVEEEPEEEPEIPNNEDRVYRIFSDPRLADIVISSNTTEKPDLNIVTGKDSIVLTNITDTRFTVVWISEEAEEGYIKYGETDTALTSEARDTRDGVLEKGKYFVHQVDVLKLEPDTKYYFKVFSGISTYDKAGVPFDIETYSTLASPPPYKAASGKVENLASPNDSVILIEIEDKDSTGSAGKSTLVSTIPSSNGSWIASIGDARIADASDYFNYTSGDQLNINLIAYAESDPVKKQTNDLDTAQIVVKAKAEEVVMPVTKVPLLNDYGVFQSLDLLLQKSGATGYDLGEEGDVEGVSTVNNVYINDNGEVLGATSIPKTGIFDLNSLVIGGIGLGFSIFLFVIYKISKANSSKKSRNSMSKVLSV